MNAVNHFLVVCYSTRDSIYASDSLMMLLGLWIISCYVDLPLCVVAPRPYNTLSMVFRTRNPKGRESIVLQCGYQCPRPVCAVVFRLTRSSLRLR